MRASGRQVNQRRGRRDMRRRRAAGAHHPVLPVLLLLPLPVLGAHARAFSALPVHGMSVLSWLMTPSDAQGVLSIGTAGEPGGLHAIVYLWSAAGLLMPEPWAGSRAPGSLPGSVHGRACAETTWGSEKQLE